VIPTAAKDVDDEGVAVGSADIDLIGDETGAMLFCDGDVVDLNTRIPAGSGWVLEDAVAINDRGQIAGTGTREGFAGTRSFLLEPDCNGNGVADLEEIAMGLAHDANGNDVPDACETCQDDLGFGGPGRVSLSVCGDPLDEARGLATLAVEGAPAGATLLLALGLENQPTPLQGGVLVPVPPLGVLELAAGPDGSLALPVQGSAGTPTSVFVQAVADQRPGPLFSNAVEVVIGT